MERHLLCSFRHNLFWLFNWIFLCFLGSEKSIYLAGAAKVHGRKEGLKHDDDSMDHIDGSANGEGRTTKKIRVIELFSHMSTKDFLRRRKIGAKRFAEPWNLLKIRFIKWTSKPLLAMDLCTLKATRWPGRLFVVISRVYVKSTLRFPNRVMICIVNPTNVAKATKVWQHNWYLCHYESWHLFKGMSLFLDSSAAQSQDCHTLFNGQAKLNCIKSLIWTPPDA